MRSALYILPLSVLAACASGPCRGQVKNTEATQTSAQAPTSTTPATPATTVQSATSTPAATTKVRIYKPDGSRQCSERVPMDLKTMQKELTQAGIKVFSSAKQRDGMMHTQVCGSATGMANTYEINAADLKKAEKLGYNRLEI